MTAVYSLKPLPFFHSCREWMGRTRGRDRTEDDAEKGRMLWEEANSCMFSLPHCLYQWSLYASFRRSCFTQACFYTLRIHPHAAAHFAVRESALLCLLSQLWKSCSCWYMQILSKYTREFNTNVRTFGPQLSTTFDKADKLDCIF